MSLTLAESAAVVGDLRRARRKQRVAAIHWVDALYQVYVTGLVAVVAVVLLSGVIGDGELGASGVADVRHHGAAVLGCVAALALFMGLRSGSRGGPLALEQPDVRHVLLSPVDRGVALRGPALRQLRFLVAVGAAVGATAGQLALRRLPGNAAEWMLVGAAFGVVVVGLGFGAALVASGSGVRPWQATLVGGLLLAWSGGDLAGKLPTSPGTLVGRLAVWPLRFDALGLLGVVVALVLVAVGLRGVSGTSLEAAERRTSLVGQLRFAVTLQDLRTVLVLRRQLAQEKPRSKPWIPARRRRPRFPVWHRGLRSVARWPASRIGRVVLLAVVAGFALRGVWSGTSPLVILAGIALWVAGLDAVEAMGQEIDHPGRTDAFPMPRGELLVRHLPVVALVSMSVGLLSAAVMAAPFGNHVPVDVAIAVGLIAGALAGCGGAVSVVQGAPEAVDTLSMMTPEIAGTRTVFRTAFPPALAVIGTLPLLAARAAERGISDPPPLNAVGIVAIPILSLATLVCGYVRFRDEIARFMKEASENLSPTKMIERQAEEREAAEAREAELLAESTRVGSKAKAAAPASGGDDGEAEAPARPARPKGPPKPKAPKPKPDPAANAGIRGGTSSKPIGRKRDQT